MKKIIYKAEAKKLPSDYKLKIDFDGEDFKNAEVYVMKNSYTGKEAVRYSAFKVGYTDNALVFQYKSKYDRLVVKAEKFNDPVFANEAVEVFLSPEGSLEYYYEFELAPNNVSFNCFAVNTKRNVCVYLKGRQRVKTATKVEDGFWYGAIMITFRELHYVPEEAEGKTFRFNAYRIDCSDKFSENLKIENGMKFNSFSPVKRKSFHTPSRFAELTFEK